MKKLEGNSLKSERKCAYTPRASALACVLLATAWSVQATILPPGGTLYPVPLTPPPGGAVVAGGAPVLFSSGLYSGSLISTVLSGDPSNPFSGAGGLTFTYQINNNALSLDKIDRLTISDFNPAVTDGGYSGPGLPPTLMDLSLAGTIGFSFLGTPIGPGELIPGVSSALLIVRTSSTTYTPALASVINGSVTSVASFAPTLVPEPSSLALLGIGAFALVARARRR